MCGEQKEEGSVEIENRNADMLFGVTPREFQEFFQDAGYKAKLEKGAATMFIRSGISGVDFSVYFYGAAEESSTSTSLQFVARFRAQQDRKVLLDRTNAWNSTKRFAKAYVDEDGDLAIDMDVLLGKGISKPQLQESVEYWGRLLNDYMRHMSS